MAYFTRQTLAASAIRIGTIVESSSLARVAAKDRDDVDILLSLSSLDKDAVDAADETLRAIEYSVYLDRRVDVHLDPATVTPATVAALQKRRRQSRCLQVATSSNVNLSTWVPWEMGFMDGARDRVATLLVLTSASDTFKAQEYFALYPAPTRPNRCSNEDDRRMGWWRDAGTARLGQQRQKVIAMTVCMRPTTQGLQLGRPK